MISREQFQQEMEEKFVEFFKDNASYRRFMESNWEEDYKSIRKHRNLTAQQFWESGMLIHLFAWVTHQFSKQHLKEWQDFEALTGKDVPEKSEKTEEPKDRDDPDFKNRKKFVMEIARMVREQRLAELNQEFSQNYKKQRLHVGGNKALFDVLGDFLRDEQDPLPIEIPDGFMEIIDPYDNEAVQQTIICGIQSASSTVKTLAGLVKGTDDPRIGVVVTFQSCLQLECDGKLVLGQQKDDVSVNQA